MMAKSITRTFLIISAALLAGGCQLINPKISLFKPSPSVSPSPKATTETYTPLPTLEPFATPVATPTPSATPSATLKTKSTTPTTKGGVKGTSTTSTAKTTTTTVVSRTSPLYDTSFDTWEITNFPGQDYEKELIIYNKSSKKVLFSLRAADKFSETVPVSVNGSFEATGEIAPQSSTSVKLKAYSNDKNPNFTTNLTLNFVDESNQIISTRTVKVTAHTPVGDKTTLESNTDADKTGNATINVTYSPNKSFPIHLVNRHSYKVNWTAKFMSSESDGRLVVSAKSGSIDPGNFWDTDIHFTSKEIGPMSQAVLQVTFNRDGNNASETKTITINVSR